MIEVETVYKIISYFMLAAVAIGLIFLVGAAIKQRHVSFMKDHPFLFSMECILVSILPALPLFFFTVSRGISIQHASILFSTLTLKCAAIHILFEISGYYKFMGI